MEHHYTDKLVTAWGGMKEMKILIDQTGISKKLAELGLPESKSNNQIDAVGIKESFWVGIWIGCFRFSHTAVVRVDEVLRQIFGWKRGAYVHYLGYLYVHQLDFITRVDHDV
jgi:hypothetical protein